MGATSTKHAVHFTTGSDDWRTPPDFVALLDWQGGVTPLGRALLRELERRDG